MSYFSLRANFAIKICLNKKKKKKKNIWHGTKPGYQVANVRSKKCGFRRADLPLCRQQMSVLYCTIVLVCIYNIQPNVRG